MNKSIIPLLLCAVVLCGCGKKKDNAQAVVTPLPEIVEITPVPAEYNSIDSVAEDVKKGLEYDILSAAGACQEIYRNADKGETYNVVLSSGTVREMVNAIAALGFSAIDFDRTMDLQSAQSMLDFGYSLFSNEDIYGTYYEVYSDGRISAYRLNRSFGQWSLITMSVRWEDDKPKIYSQGQYHLTDVQFTAKGWLIYRRDNSSFDENQKSNFESTVFLRLKPYDANLRQLCEYYIEPIGYLENNLFTTNWDENNFTPIDFNSLYAYLFARYNGTEMLSAYNALNYYNRLEKTSIVLVPESTFEKTVRCYFNIDPATLKGISDYSTKYSSYLFLGYDKDYYNVLPRTPVPEVVDFWYNSDGTLTMRVEAIDEWYGTDRSFSHEVTVRVSNDGSFKYVSNRFYPYEDTIIPECRLSTQLDIEKAKVKY